jgi:heme oxygenase
MSGLASRLREETAELHREAERTGVMRKLLTGRCDLASYCALLGNLVVLYQALEKALAQHAAHPALCRFDFARVFRARAVASDFAHLAGPGVVAVPVAATRQYVSRLDELARDDPPLLVAHAYVRYLGDLSGGRVLQAIVRRGLRLEAGTSLYDFGSDETADRLKREFRVSLDAMPLDAGQAADVVLEARRGFALHIEIFGEIE